MDTEDDDTNGLFDGARRIWDRVTGSGDEAESHSEVGEEVDRDPHSDDDADLFDTTVGHVSDAIDAFGEVAESAIEAVTEEMAVEDASDDHSDDDADLFGMVAGGVSDAVDTLGEVVASAVEEMAAEDHDPSGPGRLVSEDFDAESHEEDQGAHHSHRKAQNSHTEGHDAPPAEASVGEFLGLAVEQIGDDYRFGAEASLSDDDPDEFDSSELVQWAANRAGARMPDGSWNQYKAMARAGATTDVSAALDRPGALLFRFSSDPFDTHGRPSISHVAISLGDGRVIEATDAGDNEVQVREAGDRFNYAAVIPEFADDVIEAEDVTAMFDALVDFSEDELSPGEGSDKSEDDEYSEFQTKLASRVDDEDFDGVTTDMETMAGGMVAASVDDDHDGLTNVAEARLGTDPNNRDTDGDKIPDLMEVRLGTDPLVPDAMPERMEPGAYESDGTDVGDLFEGMAKVEGIAKNQWDAEREAADQEAADQAAIDQTADLDLGDDLMEPTYVITDPALVDVQGYLESLDGTSAPEPEVLVEDPVTVPEELMNDTFRRIDDSIGDLVVNVDEVDGD